MERYGKLEAVVDEAIVFKIGIGVVPLCHLSCVRHIGLLHLRFGFKFFVFCMSNIYAISFAVCATSFLVCTCTYLVEDASVRRYVC
jgi:hypothetical protein